MRDVNDPSVYKGHRIHTSRLFSGIHISMIVRLGKPKPQTKDSLTDTVTRVPGEYATEDEAREAAVRYIDEHASGRQK
jgi:hypothetical protein